MTSYSKYKPTHIPWLAEIPENWGVRRLKLICSFAYGDSLGATNRMPGDVPVYGSNGIVGYHDSSNMLAPCIIVGRKGSSGKLIYSEEAGFAIDTTYFIDQRFTQANLKWLYYALQCLKLDEISKDSAVPGLAREDAYNYYLPFLPELEQQRVADFLDYKTAQIDRLIEKKKALIEKLNEKRLALITQAVTKGLNPEAAMKPSDVDWLGNVPVHWEVMKLSHVVRLKSGETITSLELKLSGEYPVYGGNGHRGFFDEYTHEGEHVLIGRQGALCGNINYASGKFWASEHAVVVTPDRPVSTLWLGELLRIMNLGQYSVSAAQPGISVEMISRLKIPYPPIEEQEEIARYIARDISKNQDLINVTQKTIERLTEYRTALITAAVTGKIDVRSVDIPCQEAA